MFAPNYVYAKLDKSNFLFMLPDKSGKVYIVNESQRLNRLGSWESILAHIEKEKIKPVASLTLDEKTGKLYYAFNPDCGITDQKLELLIETKSTKLLGIDWEVPIYDQAVKLINRAIYFLGSQPVLDQLAAMTKTYESLSEDRQKIKKLTPVA